MKTLGRGLGAVLQVIARPVFWLLRKVYKTIVFPLYRFGYQTRQKWNKSFSPAKNKYLYPFIGKWMVHAVVIVLIFVVSAANLQARTLPASNGQNSILYNLVTGEDQELISEGPLTANEDSVSYLGATYGVAARQAVLSDVAPIPVMESVALITTGGNAVAALPVRSDFTPESSDGTPIRRRKRDGIDTYIVQAGDTISTIATAFSVSSNTILWENDLGPRDYIRPGQELTILPITGIRHEVAKGDTLLALAKKYDGEAEQIKEANNLEDGVLTAGTKLIIPDGTKPRTIPTYTRVATAPSVREVPQAFAAPQPQQNDTPSTQAGNTGMIWPTSGRVITQYWGWRHTGIDIDDDRPGAPIYAVEDGVVEVAGWGGGYGNQVVIRHPNGMKTRYAHMAPGTMRVRVGSVVSKGQVIGIVGTTGFSTGTHLHFEIYVNGVRRNPLLYVR